MMFKIILCVTTMVAILSLIWYLNGNRPDKDSHFVLSDHPHIESYSIAVEAKGKTLVHIRQAHLSSLGANDLDYVRIQISTQKSIAKIVESILQNERVLVCLEGVTAIKKEVAIWEDDRENLRIFREEVRGLLVSGKDADLLDAYHGFIGFIESKYPPGGVRLTQTLLAQHVVHTEVSRLGISPPPQVPVQPFGDDVKYIGGSVEYLFSEGILSETDLVVCEDEKYLLEFGDALQEELAKESPNQDRLAGLNLAREQAIVSNARAVLAGRSEVKTLIVVFGAMHDLSQAVIAENNTSKESPLRLVQVLPKPLTDKVLEEISQKR